MWTEITRPQYDRTNRRYASDPRSEPGAGFERCRVEPDRTLHAAAQAPGAPRTTALRDVAGRHPVAPGGRCPGTSRRSTVQRYCAHWRDSGLWERINRQLLMATREAQGRNAPTHRPVSSTLNPSRRPKASFADTGGFTVRFMVPMSGACPFDKLRAGTELDSGTVTAAGGAGLCAPHVSEVAPCFCRSDPFRPQIGGGTQNTWPLAPGNCQATGQGAHL